ncbi:hypothetical protein MGN70_014745 [Eutypa lata]|nr:hypothetical protein MGN70_014745 [Eutypa lata]
MANAIASYAEDYRECGTCKRTVYIEGVPAYSGREIAGISMEPDDEATLVDIGMDAETSC